MKAAARWGPELVQKLLPQREPLLLVDSVLKWEATTQPIVVASKHIAPSESVFAGHFPDRPVWPGAFMLEGLAQTSRILATLERLAAGGDRAEVVAALDNLQRWLRGEPDANGGSAKHTRDQLAALAGPGLLVGAEMRFIRPVVPDCLLEYRSTLERKLERVARFQVEASVAGDVVVRGNLTTARPEE